ncbi:antibiotic biosynthesis monooxygenase [Rhodococcus sp. SRB_17]|uniref:putative quinol monooxygenase n=1 Tax=Rhodococcus sp. OK302 TaxID=1882769 RepID=UPI000B945B93|nr:antibiotic biosynthesis monooxygenase [Rhodococcus sp. OK302]NMM86570.1 antibiotic biosynthesis monooxygenase [Rhodococcus sp. SRB_17]OYD68328.1 quinol monooxygenase YgiN [Rhodococcus sp. OK302]
MELVAILELSFKPDSLDAARTVMTRVLKETRAFSGCISVTTVVDSKSPTTWRFIETWESAEHDAEYRKFRAGEGAITDLGPLLAGAPSLTTGTVDPQV